ncbi:MAG: hypothetical protein PHQ04_01240 [Opitutaceae bacterium]|nr:hypothetical protein [Opitutaceae bacterium]
MPATAFSRMTTRALPFLRFPRAATAFPAASPATVRCVGDRLTLLYRLAENSTHVFGSPLDPFTQEGRLYHVPRFVYFVPHSSDESVRLAISAGYDHAMLQGTLALLNFVQRLMLSPEIGHGLNLSVFPLVDVLGLFAGRHLRVLASAHWGRSDAPEIGLLEKEARCRGYHGFVRVTTTVEESITASYQGRSSRSMPPTGGGLVSLKDFEPWPVRFEAARATGGPLTVADDLPLAPFEPRLGLPQSWPQELIDSAVASILDRFIVRYRGIEAYGQHL